MRDYLSAAFDRMKFMKSVDGASRVMGSRMHCLVFTCSVLFPKGSVMSTYGTAFASP